MNVSTSHKYQGRLLFVFGTIFAIGSAVLFAAMSQLPPPSGIQLLSPERGLVGGLGMIAFSMSILVFELMSDLGRTTKPSVPFGWIIGILVGFGLAIWAIFERSKELGIPLLF